MALTPKTRTTVTTVAPLLVVLALAALAPGVPAQASQATEPQQGAQVLNEVQAGRLKGASLSTTQYQRVGQYLMSRALGSTERYETMDSLMDGMMGEGASDRMYVYLGERYFGVNAQPDSRDARFYGWMGSMMSAYGASPYAGMMGRYLGEGGSGTARNPTGTYPMGPGMMGYGSTAAGSSRSSDWPTAALIAVAVLGALLLAGGLAFALPKLRNRSGGRHPAAPAGHT